LKSIAAPTTSTCAATITKGYAWRGTRQSQYQSCGNALMTAQRLRRGRSDDLLPRVLIPYDAPHLPRTERAVPVGILWVLRDLVQGDGMNYEPELRSIPLTFVDCEKRLAGTGWSIGGWICQVPRRLPDSCAFQRKHKCCPRGFQ